MLNYQRVDLFIGDFQLPCLLLDFQPRTIRNSIAMFDYQSVLEIFFRMVPLSNIIFRQISGEKKARILPFVGACLKASISGGFY